MFKKQIECDEMFHLFHFETADTFTSVNIPIEKLDYLKVREFFTKKLQLQGCYFVVIHCEIFEGQMRKNERNSLVRTYSAIGSDEALTIKTMFLHILAKFYNF